MDLAGSGPEGRGILEGRAAPTCQGLLSWLEGGSHLNIQRPGTGLGQGFQCCFLTRTSPGMLPARTTAGGELGDTEVSWRPMTTRVPLTSHLLWQCCLPVISHNPHTCPKQIVTTFHHVLQMGKLRFCFSASCTNLKGRKKQSQDLVPIGWAASRSACLSGFPKLNPAPSNPAGFSKIQPGTPKPSFVSPIQPSSPQPKTTPQNQPGSPSPTRNQFLSGPNILAQPSPTLSPILLPACFLPSWDPLTISALSRRWGPRFVTDGTTVQEAAVSGRYHHLVVHAWGGICKEKKQAGQLCK